MEDLSEGGVPSNESLLKALQVAVAVGVLGTVGLYIKGNRWAREAALVNPLAMEAQRSEAAVRSLLFEAYQWNQSHPTPELTDFLQRLKVTVQAPSPATGGSANPPPAKSNKVPNR